jgi:hypothetical protein
MLFCLKQGLFQPASSVEFRTAQRTEPFSPILRKPRPTVMPLWFTLVLGED